MQRLRRDLSRGLPDARAGVASCSASPELDAVREALGADEATGAIVKDEARCIRCGLCAERCPTGAITMEALEIDESPQTALGLYPRGDERGARDERDGRRTDRGAGRREFFAVGCVGIGAATAGFLASTFRFLVPNVLYEPSRRFDIGSPARLPAGLGHVPARPAAVPSSTAPTGSTHLVGLHAPGLQREARAARVRVPVPRQPVRRERPGRPRPGAAPLAWYALSLSPRGELVVDLDRTVGPDFRLRA